jgi:non-specific serine/threonine protein kinase/serine/threonine-protein kinase
MRSAPEHTGAAPGPHCPSDAQLESALSDAGSAAGVHVRSCPACAARLENLRRDVSLLDEFSRAERSERVRRTGSAERLAGEYQIVAEVHRGGQGVVYRAVQLSTGRTVALKMLLHGVLATERQRLRFDREIELASGLSHPGIAAVYAAGTTDEGQHFLVMPFVEGIPLDEFATALAATAAGVRGRRAACRRALELFVQLCDAVAHAHARGVIHRDLKPGNVLVDRDGHVHVLDFGLAKASASDGMEARLSVPGEFMGTLAYASPEHLRGNPEAIDVRSDVYSVGVMLYRVVAGRPPFAEGEGPASLMHAIAEGEPRRIGRGGSRGGDTAFPIDRDLETIVLKAMAKEPGRRYQTAGELGLDLGRYLRGQAIDARRDSAAYVLRKFVARHRAGTGAVTVCLALAAGFAVATHLQNGVIRSQRDAIRNERDAAFAAKGSAQKQRERAEEARGIAESTNTILVKILESGDPHEAQGRDVTVAEVLNRSDEWLGKDLADLPVVEASVRTTLGRVYLNLGRVEDASKQLERAVAVRERIGSPDIETARALNDLAAARLTAGKLADAETLALRSVAMYRAAVPALDARLADGLAVLARIYYPQGRTAECEAVSREIWEIRRVTLGESDPKTVQSLLSIAAAVNQRGGLVEAEDLTRRAEEGLIGALGEREHESLIARNNHMICLHDLGRLALAEAEGRRLLALQAEVLGPDHPESLASRIAYASVLADLGRFDEAEQMLRHARATLAARFGRDHPRAVLADMAISGIMLKTGRIWEAAALRDSVLESRRRTMGPASPKTLPAMTDLAEALAMAGAPELAAPLAEAAVETYERQPGGADPARPRAVEVLARVRTEQGRFAEAECLQRQTLDTRRAMTGAGELGKVAALRRFGDILLRGGHDGNAIAAWAEAYCRAWRIEGPGHPLLHEVCDEMQRR